MSALADKLVPSETALIVVDKQNDFCAIRFGRNMSSNF